MPWNLQKINDGGVSSGPDRTCPDLELAAIESLAVRVGTVSPGCLSSWTGSMTG